MYHTYHTPLGVVRWYARELVRQIGWCAMDKRERILQHAWRAKDYAEMSPGEFDRMLNEVTDIAILEGIANRRKHLQAAHLTKWKPWQVEAILRRQWELRHG